MIVYLKLLVLFVRIVDLIIYQSINFIEFERIQSNMNHIIIHLCFFVIFIFHKVNINYGFLGNLKNTKCFQPVKLVHVFSFRNWNRMPCIQGFLSNLNNFRNVRRYFAGNLDSCEREGLTVSHLIEFSCELLPHCRTLIVKALSDRNIVVGRRKKLCSFMFYSDDLTPHTSQSCP